MPGVQTWLGTSRETGPRGFCTTVHRSPPNRPHACTACIQVLTSRALHICATIRLSLSLLLSKASTTFIMKSNGSPLASLLLHEKWNCSRSAVSNSLRPHELQPTRLPCPWDSPEKNTGVGSHSLLQGIFPTQGSNPGLLHCRQVVHCLSCQVLHESAAFVSCSPPLHQFTFFTWLPTLKTLKVSSHSGFQFPAGFLFFPNS